LQTPKLGFRGKPKTGGQILATHPSAIKRARQNKKRRTRNIHVVTTVRHQIKEVRSAVEKKDAKGAQEALKRTIPLIQKARSKGVFHGNTAARRISKLTREVNALAEEA
jgi:small subunit ribosomal protein S20